MTRGPDFIYSLKSEVFIDICMSNEYEHRRAAIRESDGEVAGGK